MTKFDFRVAQIKQVKNHPNSDKLYILQLNVGHTEKQIIAGIKPYYTPEQLQQRNIIIVNNLKPVKLRGEESCGMLLAAEDDNKHVELLSAPNSKPGDIVQFEDFKSQPVPQVMLDDFLKLKLITNDNKNILYKEKIFKTKYETVFVETLKGGSKIC